MPQFPVSLSKQQALTERMARLGIHEADLEEQFTRSSGHGGQNINKTSTCVVLQHLPSGIRVKCQQERSQSLNRYLARRLLVEKIEAEQLGRASLAEQQREKIRRQKRKRSRRAKAKMLANKRHQAEKKQGRAKNIPDTNF